MASDFKTFFDRAVLGYVEERRSKLPHNLRHWVRKKRKGEHHKRHAAAEATDKTNTAVGVPVAIASAAEGCLGIGTVAFAGLSLAVAGIPVILSIVSAVSLARHKHKARKIKEEMKLFVTNLQVVKDMYSGRGRHTKLADVRETVAGEIRKRVKNKEYCLKMMAYLAEGGIDDMINARDKYALALEAMKTKITVFLQKAQTWTREQEKAERADSDRASAVDLFLFDEDALARSQEAALEAADDLTQAYAESLYRYERFITYTEFVLQTLKRHDRIYVAELKDRDLKLDTFMAQIRRPLVELHREQHADAKRG